MVMEEKIKAELEKILEPIRDFYPPHPTLANEADKKGSVIDALLKDITIREVKGLSSKETACLKEAFSKGLAAEEWSDINTWLSFWQYLKRRHYDNNNDFFETKTDEELRIKFIGGIYASATKMLWYNTGGVNENVFEKDEENSEKILGKKLSDILKDTLRKYKPIVIFSFGRPQDKEGVWRNFAEKQIEFINSVPCLKAVNDYRSGDGKGRTVLIALKKRVQNHFGFAWGQAGSLSAQQMILEALHNENQPERVLCKISETQALRLEMGLMTNHYLNLATGALMTDESVFVADEAVYFF